MTHSPCSSSNLICRELILWIQFSSPSYCPIRPTRHAEANDFFPHLSSLSQQIGGHSFWLIAAKTSRHPVIDYNPDRSTASNDRFQPRASNEVSKSQPSPALQATPRLSPASSILAVSRLVHPGPDITTFLSKPRVAKTWSQPTFISKLFIGWPVPSCELRKR